MRRTTHSPELAARDALDSFDEFLSLGWTVPRTDHLLQSKSLGRKYVLEPIHLTPRVARVAQDVLWESSIVLESSVNQPLRLCVFVWRRCHLVKAGE